MIGRPFFRGCGQPGAGVRESLRLAEVSLAETTEVRANLEFHRLLA